MGKPKVLFISQEITPYLPETPLSSLGGNLPRVAQEKGFEVRTFMPKYGCINERRNQLHEVIRLSGMNLIIDDTDHPLIIKVATLQPSRMQVYFIDSDDYFHFSPDKKLETLSSPDDNDERQMFFVRGVIETVKKLRWEPAIIYCSGWITALAPLYIKKMFHDDPSLANAKIVFDIRPEAFDGTLDGRFVEKLEMGQFAHEDLNGLSESPVDIKMLTKFAIDYADIIVQSSDNADADIVAYAVASGKPFLPYNKEVESEAEMVQHITDFYKQIIEE